MFLFFHLEIKLIYLREENGMKKTMREILPGGGRVLTCLLIINYQSHPEALTSCGLAQGEVQSLKGDSSTQHTEAFQTGK